MESKVNNLQENYQTLINAYKNLEELNTKWASKNTSLNQEINVLKVLYKSLLINHWKYWLAVEVPG